MPEYICPFSATLSKDDFSCEHANKIIRRGGEEFSCREHDMHVRCSEIYVKVRSNALQALGLEDNLLTLPHSILVKIQFGCILGLQADSGNDATGVENISSVIEPFNSGTQIPYTTINDAIRQYKSPKRRKK